jgi:site-specific DNA-methyltransferase (adenine-specific)
VDVKGRIYVGDAAETMQSLDDKFQCIVTSPPYWQQRDVVGGGIGMEVEPGLYKAAVGHALLCALERLRDDGVMFVNLGDKRGPEGGLLGLPWKIAAMLSEFCTLRSEIIWHKRVVMPESVKNRPTLDHEHVFMFTKSRDYYWNADAIAEPVAESTLNDKRDPDKAGRPDRKYPGQASRGGHLLGSAKTRNKRTVWSLNPEPYFGDHSAVMPKALAEICVRAATREGDVVLDPFCGAGTTGLVAMRLGRKFSGIEIDQRVAMEAKARIVADAPMFHEVELLEGIEPVG